MPGAGQYGERAQLGDVRDQTAWLIRGLVSLLFAAACALLTWSAVWIAYPRSYGDWRTDNLVLALLCLAGPLIAVARSLYALASKTRTQNGWVGIGLRFAIAVLTLLALLFVSFARLIDAGFINATSAVPVLAGLGLVLGMAATGLLRLALPVRVASSMHERVLDWLVVASVGLPLAGMLLWSVLNILLVEWRATTIAGSDPYCLQVPAGSIRYEPVTRWSQLAGLRMQAPWEEAGGGVSREWQWAFHAVLVVQRKTAKEFYNWSYVVQDFVRLPDETRRFTHVSAVCEPKPGFLYGLELF